MDNCEGLKQGFRKKLKIKLVRADRRCFQKKEVTKLINELVCKNFLLKCCR